MDALILNGKTYHLSALTHNATLVRVTPYEQRVLQLAQDWLSGQETFTLHTSGSTGTPKPIHLTRAQMATSARWTGQALGLQAGDAALVCMSVEYIAGFMMLVRGFELGLPLTIIDPTSQPLAALPPDTCFAFTAMVPLQLQATLHGAAHERAILNRMKGILIGGAPVSVPLEEQAQQVHTPLYHTYGMTETVSHVALRRMNGAERSDYFVPFPEVRLEVDARECLVITAAVTNGETVQTNDRVALRADGAFRWLGRLDNVINSGGVKVQVEKVETAMETWLLQYQNGLHAERRFFVGAIQDARLGQAVVAVLEGEPFGGEPILAPELATEIRTALQQTLSRYEVPRHFFFVPKLLETPTGKIDRRANLASLAATAPANV